MLHVYFSNDFFAVFIHHFGLDFRSLHTAVFILGANPLLYRWLATYVLAVRNQVLELTKFFKGLSSWGGHEQKANFWMVFVFQSGETCTEDLERSGRPSPSQTHKNL